MVLDEDADGPAPASLTNQKPGHLLPGERALAVGAGTPAREDGGYGLTCTKRRDPQFLPRPRSERRVSGDYAY